MNANDNERLCFLHQYVIQANLEYEGGCGFRKDVTKIGNGKWEIEMGGKSGQRSSGVIFVE